MKKGESIQRQLQKVRPPRVQMTYDVEIGDAVESKELPFLVGVLGDFSGDSGADKKRLKERKFVEIDQGNFDDVLAGMAPAVRTRVPDVLNDDGGEFEVRLEFRSMADFRPESIVDQVEPLARLRAAREKLADLRNKVSSNDKFEEVLAEVLHNTEKMKALADALPRKES